jgi:hypothetical protein
MLRTTALFILVFVLATQGWAQMTVRNQSTGTTLMQVTDAGQVGIALGSNAPQATLDVGGTLRIGTVEVEGNTGDISVLVVDGGVVKKRTLTADIWDGDATGVGSETDPEWSANDDDHVIGNEKPIAGNHITISNTYTVNHADGSSQSSVNGSGRTVIQDVSLDTYGHVTGLNTTTLADNVNDADHDPSGELQNLRQVLSRGNNANNQSAVNFDALGVNTTSPKDEIEIKGDPNVSFSLSNGDISSLPSSYNNRRFFRIRNRTNGGETIFDFSPALAGDGGAGADAIFRFVNPLRFDAPLLDFGSDWGVNGNEHSFVHFCPQTVGTFSTFAVRGSASIGSDKHQGYDFYVDGSAAKPGGGSWSNPSDRRLKTIGADFTRGLDAINSLTPMYYHYKPDNAMELPTDKEHVGLIAQEVQEVIPEAVETKDDGYLLLNNDPIIWTMLNGIKELNKQNNRLSDEIDALRQQNETLRQEIDAIKAQL